MAKQPRPCLSFGRVTNDCEHGAASHDERATSMASAPEASRAWLLVEHPGPWPPEAAEARFPARLAEAVAQAAALGIRVQLIRRPGPVERLSEERSRTMYAGWTAGEAPWLRRGTTPAGLDPAVPDREPGVPDREPGVPDLDLAALAAGQPISFGEPVPGPVFLVCGHARRNPCCGRLGVSLARTLAGRYPGHVWQTTHVGGHRFAANLVILPHGLYYGPVAAADAATAIAAYGRGEVVIDRYRGRAGQPRVVQEDEYARLRLAGSLPVADLA
jgi:hypothetical protein